jgi:hypothetical protein
MNKLFGRNGTIVYSKNNKSKEMTFKEFGWWITAKGLDAVLKELDGYTLEILNGENDD